MSQYISFYKDGVEIGFCSRNSKVYRAFENDIPYEAGEKVPCERFWGISDMLFEEQEKIIANIRSKYAERASVPTWNNSVDEKVSLIEDIDAEIYTLMEEFEEISQARGIVNMLGMNDNVYAGIEWDGSLRSPSLETSMEEDISWEGLQRIENENRKAEWAICND